MEAAHVSPRRKTSLTKGEEKSLPIAVRRGPKPKKTRIVATWLPKVRHFQKLFSPYFSHLADDLDAAGFEMDWLYTRVLGNPFDTIRRSKAKKELAKIATALRLMGEHETAYWLPLMWIIRQAKENGDLLADHVEKIFTFLLDLDQLEEEGVLGKVVKRFADNAATAIDQVQDQGKVNWKAVHAVEGLRILWWRNTGNDGPSRALNPASRFAKYLKDGFDFLEIKANPESAFKRWVAAYPKHVG